MVRNWQLEVGVRQAPSPLTAVTSVETRKEARSPPSFVPRKTTTGLLALGSIFSCLTPVLFCRAPCGPNLTSIRRSITSLMGFGFSFEGSEAGAEGVVEVEVVDVEEPVPPAVTGTGEVEGRLSVDEPTPVIVVGVTEAAPDEIVSSLALLGRAVKCLRNGFLLLSRSSRLR